MPKPRLFKAPENRKLLEIVFPSASCGSKYDFVLSYCRRVGTCFRRVAFPLSPRLPLGHKCEFILQKKTDEC